MCHLGLSLEQTVIVFFGSDPKTHAHTDAHMHIHTNIIEENQISSPRIFIRFQFYKMLLIND